MRRRTLLAAVAATLLLDGRADAATFTVSTTADGSTCNQLTCTLRGAINAAVANGTAEPDQIVLGEGAHILNSSLDMTEMTAATGITIVGAGANRTSIQPPTPNGTYRVLTTASGANLTLRNLTVRDGRNASNAGGNIAVNANTTLNLDGVRVTGGSTGTNGAGIAAVTGTTLNITNSLLDGNLAPTGAAGAIFTQGILNLTDSTVTRNQARNYGAIYMFGAAASATLRGVTLAYNESTSSQPPTAGGITSSQGPVTLQGSLIAGNISTQLVNGAEIDLLVNCGFGGAVTDGGGNIEDADYCKLNSGTYTNPQLATALDETQQPPTLNLPAGSPAIDVADCAGRALDQRGVARPQGARCDAGAFELVQPPQPPPTQTPTPSATPAPTPVVNRSVVVDEVKGTVKVKLPGTTKFIDLDATRGIPVGSTVDTKKGTVKLTSIPKPGEPAETANFYDGIFRVSQANGITTLTLTEALAPCPKRGRAAAAATKPKKRKLWGDGKGKFRTSGKYSAATVRGTKWLVEDSCDGTLTRVAQGSVTVRDNVLKKNIVLRATKKYLAKPKR